MNVKNVLKTVAELSAYHWVLTFVSLVLGELNVWGALAGFATLLALKFSHKLRIRIATLVVDNVSESFFDLVDWEKASVVVRVRVRGGGDLSLFISLSTLMYAATLLAALAVVRLPQLDYLRVSVLLTAFALSVLFYRSASTYVRAIGVGVFVSRAIAYAILVSLLVWLSVGGSGSLILSALLNFLAVVVGCDVLSIRRAVLNSARSLTIGGLGLYDAVILIPVVSYFASSLLATALGALA